MTAGEYTDQLRALLPRGEAWAAPAGSVLHGLLAALAETLARVHQRLIDLVDEADPRTTSQLLADWEAAAGLPDPCVTAPLTTAERRNALVARLTATGGATRAYFIGVAERLGYEGVTITEPSPHVWQMNIPETTNITWARAGQSRAGDPIRSWGNEQLECLIARLKPAHTRVLFSYGA